MRGNCEKMRTKVRLCEGRIYMKEGVYEGGYI